MVLSFSKKKEYKIGRSHLADVTDKSDLLVSRINTTITYKESTTILIQIKFGSKTAIQSTGPALSSTTSSNSLLKTSRQVSSTITPAFISPILQNHHNDLNILSIFTEIEFIIIWDDR